MIRNIFNTPTINLIERGLDLSGLRHKVIAENMAHAETPGYKKKEVPFSEVLNMLNNRSFDNREAKAIFSQADLSKHVKTIKTVSQRNDGNNVDVDEEAVKLAQNTLFYQSLSDQVRIQFGHLRTVITGGRR